MTAGNSHVLSTTTLFIRSNLIAPSAHFQKHLMPASSPSEMPHSENRADEMEMYLCGSLFPDIQQMVKQNKLKRIS